MENLIRLLPEAVANQIAAGEVIQRPASAVKELLENSVDAGATRIEVHVRDAGRSMIRIIDNGMGMNPHDARMAFERHATSKLKSAEDLFNIRTKGFRGEALASIASVAQVELKTRLHNADLGTSILIEGSNLINEESCQTSPGTSITVKNLFFNVPARRNFLKSDLVEFRHVSEEFLRVALAHPEIEFRLIHNQNEVFFLPSGNIRQRITAAFGNSYNEKLVPIEEDTTIVKATGFVGKPEFARKTRGDQYFFINRRFVKSPYLHHAVQAAFTGLIPRENFAPYFIYLEVDPSRIDVNIHPTKTEVKFDDEQSIYSILRSTVKKGLGKNHITPSIDFDTEASVDLPLNFENKTVNPPVIKVNTAYNPFESPKTKPKIFEGYEQLTGSPLQTPKPQNRDSNYGLETQRVEPLLFHRKFIICQVKSGVWVIHFRRALERLTYDDLRKKTSSGQIPSQQLLFPEHLEMGPENFMILKENMEAIRLSGFDLNEFGPTAFVLHGTPSDLSGPDAIGLLEEFSQKYRESGANEFPDIHDYFLKIVSRKIAQSHSGSFRPGELNGFIDRLFASSNPALSPTGKKIFLSWSLEDLEKKFEN
jgi:DNA mismatch repair protein MutL